MKNRFSSIAFLTTKPLVRSLQLQPFVVEIIDGILSRERFVYYIQQDSLYLTAFANALCLTAGKISDPDDTALTLTLASTALASGRALHKLCLQGSTETSRKDKTPACFAYCNHILARSSLGSPAESMAALLPRYRIFRELGNHVRSLADTDNIWFGWIEAYSNSDFSLLVDNVCDLADRLASGVSDEERQNMLDAYIASSRYECSLLEDAYTLCDWPL